MRTTMLGVMTAAALIATAGAATATTAAPTEAASATTLATMAPAAGRQCFYVVVGIAQLPIHSAPTTLAGTVVKVPEGTGIWATENVRSGYGGPFRYGFYDHHSGWMVARYLQKQSTPVCV